MEYFESRDDLDVCTDTEDSRTEMTPMQSFYHRQHIFITGGSGFIGEVLIEKLLRSCNVEKIYLLLRTKKGKKPEERIKEQFTDELFSPLKRMKPNFVEKIHMIAGDIEMDRLGVSDEDIQLLINNISIVIHGAATLSMDDPIEKSFNMNIRATKYLLDMFEKMPNKKSFSYISTAFAHAHRLHIDEKFYPTSLSEAELQFIVETMDPCSLACLSPKLIGAYSNSYSYSKALAEEVCREYVNKGLPVGIVRPSIVVSSYREPIRAWINNVYGATGVLFGASIGFLHIFFADPSARADLIPVDVFANTTLASIWEVSQRSSEDTAGSVYNCVTSTQNPLTWDQFKTLNEISTQVHPISSNKTLYAYSFSLTKSPFWFHTCVLLTHVLPAIFVDLILKLKNKEPMLLKAHRKVTNFLKHFHHYAEKDWVYTNDNVQRLWLKLSPDDQRLFFFNCQDIQWKEFYSAYLRGVKKYFLKETSELEELERSARRQRRLILLHTFVKYGSSSLLTVFLGYLTWVLFS